jgi:hypothetical protein
MIRRERRLECEADENQISFGWSCTLSGDFRKYRAYNCRPNSFGSDFDDKRAPILSNIPVCF